jgi:hypothetical protein
MPMRHLLPRIIGLLILATVAAFPLNALTVETQDNRPDADSPDRAAAWRRLSLVDENGTIPEGAKDRALRQRQALLRPSPRILGDQWVERGPDNLAGRSECIVIDPTNPSILYAGSAGGGVWKSTDGGASWTQRTDSQLATLAVGALTLDPKNSSVIYAGTGEGLFNGDAIQGFGTYKSTDAGLTWTLLPSTSKFGNVNKIAISPTDSNLILEATQYGGIRRSADGGVTWKTVRGAQLGHSVSFNPANPSIAIASVLDYDFTRNNWFTEADYSSDGGVTWKAATGVGAVGFGRIEVQPATKDANVAYASASDGKIYKSVDSGVTYTVQTTSGSTGSSWYCCPLWIDPTNSNFIVTGGTNVFKSADGGVTLQKIGQGYIQTDQPHPDFHYVTPAPGFDGTKNKTVYLCTDGGVYVTADIYNASTGGGWKALANQSRSSQFYSVAGDGPTGEIVGGTQDNGTQAIQPGTRVSSWPFGGDGGFVAIDAQKPQYVYGEYIDLELWRSDAGGAPYSGNWIYTGITDAGAHANFIAPFVLDVNNPETLLAGGRSLWRSTNARASAPTWSAIRGPGSDNISAIAVAKGNSDLIWIAQNDGQLWKTANGTAINPIWTAIDDNSKANPLPNRYINRIVIDPDDANIVYVALGGYSANNLWKTTDGGTTWVPITGMGAGVLPQAPIRAIARDPFDPKTLFVGTEIGVFSTSDGGVTWSTTNDAPANVSVDELAYMNNSSTLLAGTHGRGIWMLTRTGTISALSLSPSPVTAGTTSTGTITVNAPALTPGTLVSLSSSSSNLTVPASVTIPRGSKTVTFPVSASIGSEGTVATITATSGTSKKSLSVSIVASKPAKLSLSSSNASAPSSATATLTLTGPAPSGGLTFNVSTDSTSLTVPTTITVPQGQSGSTFMVKTSPVAVPTVATITVGTVSAKLTIQPTSVAVVSLSPTSVFGGIPSTGTVSLLATAYTDVTIQLATTSTALTIPASIVISGGKRSATFSIGTTAVAVSTPATIVASLGSTSSQSTLTLKPPYTTSLTLDPTSVVGGSSTVVTGTVSLNSVAPAGGLTVPITASSPTITLVPASVVIPAGTTKGTFTFTTTKVKATTSVSVYAKFGATVSTKLSVTP